MIKEDEILTIDDKDLMNLDLKLNPDFYIHTALLMAQKTLMYSVVKTSIGEGLIAYSIFIEHLEVLCRAAKHLTEEYDKNIKEYLESQEYTETKRDDVKRAKIANKKLQFMMKDVFDKRKATIGLKI
jgi:hypothetical protein